MSCNIKIVFDNDQTIYCPGHVVKGNVIVDVTEQISFSALKITFNGSASCKFEDSIDSSFLSYDVTFTGHEKYISYSTYLFGSSKSDLNDFKPGAHSIFPFDFKIPNDIPPSIHRGKYGKLRYHVEANLQTGWNFDLYARESFSIIKFEDLSKRTDLMIPISDEIFTSFLCWSCQTRPLKMKASIPFSGYVPEQIIRVTIIIYNHCGFDVSATSVSIKKEIMSISQSPEHRKRREVKTLTLKKEIGAKSRKLPSKIQSEISVPKFTQPTNITSKIVKLSYYIQISLDVIGFMKSPKVLLPIYVGTKALNFENKK